MVALAARIPQCFGRTLRREEGQDLVEYALLIMLIALVVFGAVSLLGPVIRDAYGDSANTLFPG